MKHYRLFQFSWFFLAYLLIASWLKAVKATTIAKEAPWQVVWFSLGLYIVVYGLKNAGLTDEIAYLLEYLNTQSQAVAVIGTGFIVAGLSALMNNMPTIIVMDIALEGIKNDAMIYANIIGCNLGPKMTPFGSTL